MLYKPIKDLNCCNKSPRLTVTNSTNKLYSNNVKKDDSGQKLYSGYSLHLEKFNRAVRKKSDINLSKIKGKTLRQTNGILKL